MTKYRKKPVEIEARLLLDGPEGLRIADWINRGGGRATTSSAGRQVLIETLEGTMRADVGDYVIQGVAGEFYPCKADIFHATYDRVLS